MDKFRAVVFGIFLSLFGLSFVNAPFLKHQYLQHCITVLSLIVYLYYDNKKRFSRKSFLLFMSFMALHVLAARYVYSYVPYDDWSQTLFGFRINDAFHFTRNHFDRFVHFCYGLLIFYPSAEVFRKFSGLSRKMSLLVAVLFILGSSALYEIAEWMVAITLDPSDAEAYNGQQGDMFDAPKDMAMATLGMIVSLAIILINGKYLHSVERNPVGKI